MTISFILDFLLASIGAGTLIFWLIQLRRGKFSLAGTLEPWSPSRWNLLGFCAFFVAQPVFAGMAGGLLAWLNFQNASALHASFFAQEISLIFLILALNFCRKIFPPTCDGNLRERISTLLAPWRGNSIWQLFCVLIGLIVLASALSNLLPLAFPQLTEIWQQKQQLVELLSGETTAIELACITLSAVFLTPIIEEFIFRFAFYRFFKGALRGNAILAAIFAGIIFALMHDSPATWLPLFVLNGFFCFAYEKTGRLFVPIALHALFNAHSLLLVALGN